MFSMILLESMADRVFNMSTKDRIQQIKARIELRRPVSEAHKKRSVNRYSQMKHGVKRYANYKRTN